MPPKAHPAHLASRARDADNWRAAPASAPEAAAANPKRVLAPFVPSKPGPCKNCEVCKVRREIAETQKAIRAAWARQDEMATRTAAISDVVRVPLTAEAEAALLRRVINSAFERGAGGYDPSRVHLLPMARIRALVVALLRGEPLPAGAFTASAAAAAIAGANDRAGAARLEEALRSGDRPTLRVEYAAPRDAAHLKALLHGSDDGVAWHRGGFALGATLRAATPSLVVVALVVDDVEKGNTPRSAEPRRVPVALYGRRTWWTPPWV